MSGAPLVPVCSVMLLSRHCSLRLLVSQILAAPGSGGTCSMHGARVMMETARILEYERALKANAGALPPLGMG